MNSEVFGHGPTPAPWMLIGERPGKAEAAMGRPFVGPAGLELNSYLSRAGIRRSEGYVTNLVKSYSEGNKDPSPSEIEEYAPLLVKELKLVRPRVVGAVGRFAARWLLDIDDVEMDVYHGLVFDRPSYQVVVCYHTAAGLHQPELAARSADNFLTFGAALRGQAKVWAPDSQRRIRRLLSGSGPQARAALLAALPASRGGLGNTAGDRVRIAIDTEGTPRRPFCLSFSTRPGEAYVILTRDEDLIACFRDWLDASGAIVDLHNALWDLDVLAAMGIFPRKFDDTMVKTAQLTLEPQGLKALSFRKLGARMQSYDDLTHAYRAKAARRYLTKALIASEPLPKPEPVLEYIKGETHIRKPQHVSLRIKNAMGAEEPWKAWGEVEEEIRGPVEALVGELPPFTLAEVPIEEVVSYAGADADYTGELVPVLDRALAAIEPHTYQVDRDAIPMFAHMQRVGMLLDVPHLKALKRDCSNRMLEIEHELSREYYGGKPFNPRSTPNVKDLLFDRLGLETRIKTKTKGEDSTGDKAIRPLAKHPAVALIIEYRMNATIDSRFTHALWKSADPEGRVHPHWRITKGKTDNTEGEGGTVTGRPSCTDPNLLAIPVRTEKGRMVRAGFIAGDGFKMGGADLNQIEMRYMAHESEDELLLQWYSEGRDVHSETAARIFGVPLAQVDKYKHRDPAKRVGFGIITGITGVGLFDQFELNGITGWSVQACDELILDYMKLHPGVRAYMSGCYREAEAFGYVKTRLGRVRYLPGIHSRQPRVRAEAQRASHSHKIQGGAAELLKIAMAQLWAQLRKWWAVGIKVDPLLQIYDELVLQVEEGYEDLVMNSVKAILESPSSWMRVPVLAEVHVGDNWRDLK